MSMPPEDNQNRFQPRTGGNNKLAELVKDLNLSSGDENDFDVPNGLMVQPDQGNYSTLYIPASQEYFTGSAISEQSNDLYFEVHQSNDESNFAYGQPNPPEQYNLSSDNFVVDRYTPMVMESPDVVNQPTAPMQQFSTENTDEAMDTHFNYMLNMQNYVQENYTYQQPPSVIQPTASITPLEDDNPEDRIFVQVGNKLLVLAKADNIVLKKPIALNAEAGTASSTRIPIVHQTPHTVRQIQQSPQVLTPIQSPRIPNILSQRGNSNNVNTRNFNPFQFNPRPSGSNLTAAIIPKQAELQPRLYNSNNSKFVHNQPILPAPPKPFQSVYGQVATPEVAFPPLQYPILQIRPSSQIALQKNSVNLQKLKTKFVADVRPNLDGAIQRRKPCNCTKSQCLKLYCECFASSGFCQDCNCTNCCNNMENEKLRSEAIKSCLERNPNAFSSKVGKSGGVHKKGCNCKRSGCLKKYCECFDADIPCSSNCKCEGCQNGPNEEDKIENPVDISDEDVAEPQADNTFDGVVEVKVEREKNVANLFTDDVIDAVNECMLTKAAENTENYNEKEQLGQVMEAFNNSMKEILIATTKENYEPKCKKENT